MSEQLGDRVPGGQERDLGIGGSGSPADAA